MRFWLMCVLLAPLLFVQARRARRDTPRLPEAGGADRHRNTVTWQVIGVNGIRALGFNRHLGDRPPAEADLTVISLGVNDTTGVTRPSRYRQHLTDLIGTLRRHRPDLPVYLLAVPPMQHFTALPRPLRDLLGQRAAQLDRVQQTLAAQLHGVHHLAYPAIADPACLAEDGYHPSEKGYAYIAGQVAGQLRPTTVSGAVVDVTRSP